MAAIIVFSSSTSVCGVLGVVVWVVLGGEGIMSPGGGGSAVLAVLGVMVGVMIVAGSGG